MPINTFGSYDYERRTFLSSHPESQDAKTRFGGRVGQHGGYSGGGLSAPSRMTLSGYMGGSRLGTISVEEAWTELAAGHAFGTPVPLRLDHIRPNRYRWAECTTLREIEYNPPIIGGAGFEADFAFPDPFFYHLTDNGPQSLTVGSSTNVGVIGKAQTPARISVVLTHPGTVSISHAEGTFKLIGHSIGTYSIENHDMRGQWVTWNTSNYWHDWDGIYPYLNPGTNSVGVSVTYGTVSSASIRWTNRDN